MIKINSVERTCNVGIAMNVSIDDKLFRRVSVGGKLLWWKDVKNESYMDEQQAKDLDAICKAEIFWGSMVSTTQDIEDEIQKLLQIHN